MRRGLNPGICTAQIPCLTEREEIHESVYRPNPDGWFQLCADWLGPLQRAAVVDRAEHCFFSLLGTTYGGDGVSTFALPNLQSRVPVHQGRGPA
jgi:microcystin-dependent protein